MQPMDVIKKVMDTKYEMSDEEVEQCAATLLGSAPAGVSVGDLYLIGHNLELLGKNLIWTLSHNQLDQTKKSPFVAGEDVKRAMV